MPAASFTSAAMAQDRAKRLKTAGECKDCAERTGLLAYYSKITKYNQFRTHSQVISPQCSTEPDMRSKAKNTKRPQNLWSVSA